VAGSLLDVSADCEILLGINEECCIRHDIADAELRVELVPSGIWIDNAERTLPLIISRRQQNSRSFERSRVDLEYYYQVNVGFTRCLDIRRRRYAYVYLACATRTPQRCFVFR